MRDRAQEVAAQNIQVLGVSFDSIQENKSFADKFDFPYPLLCDVDKALGAAYHAGTGDYAKRISYVIEKGKILLAYEKVDPKGHLDQILSDLA